MDKTSLLLGIWVDKDRISEAEELENVIEASVLLVTLVDKNNSEDVELS